MVEYLLKWYNIEVLFNFVMFVGVVRFGYILYILYKIIIVEILEFVVFLFLLCERYKEKKMCKYLFFEKV